MKCPYCGSALVLGDIYQECDWDIIDGYIACDCSEYPILGGILIFKIGLLNSYLVKLLKAGMRNRALGFALDNSNGKICAISDFLESSVIFGHILKKFFIYLAKIRAGRHYVRYSDAAIPYCDLLGNGNFDTYLKNRFSSETLWSIYPFIPLLKDRQERILDLSCGMGHSSFILSTYIKPRQLFCADLKFSHLYMAKKYFAPDATFICLNANYALPFEDDFFSSLLMLDAFQSIQGRAGLAREMERVISPQGIILLLHLHNSLIRNVSPGITLPPSGWANLFQQVGVKTMPEKNVVEDFLLGNHLDLAREYSEADLNSSNALIVIGTNDKSVLHAYPNALSSFLEIKHNLIINPIYAIDHRRDRVILHRKFPSEFFRSEYPLTEKYLPNEYILDEKLALASNGRYLNIKLARLSEKDLLNVEEMMKNFAVINAPENYS
ncbi:Ubiquinone/menaquinone biosynthesis C-methyltransferase UbiE [uncultured archaeon]|nr:Ubiquinone/menaquinone biosynthesis C-methyltransferase UbiE [uncultured archaeon]